MSDCVSRQAVKEILDKYQLRYHIYPYVWDEINALPPAQPDVPDINVGDTISRQAAIDALTTYIYNVCRGINKQVSIDRCEVAAKSVIGELPTVQPNTSELINRIRSEINSKNRNSADYFIVDRIERIVNEWENEHGTDSN